MTPEQREDIVKLKRRNFSQRRIAEILEISRGAVQRTLKRLKDKGTYHTLTRKGRPQKLNKYNKRWLKRYVMQNRKSSLSELQQVLLSALNLEISENSLRRYLHKMGYRGCVSLKKPWLSGINQTRRLLYAKQHSRLSVRHWDHVLWSDESTFLLFGNRCRSFVWRKPGERLIPACLQPTVKHGGGSIMVWGCMSSYGPGPLFRVTGSMNSIQYRHVLNDVMLPFCRKTFDQNFIFQQDNAPCHTSLLMRSWFEENDVQKLNWPPQSPDLSPIENLWQTVGLGLKRYKLSNLDDLWTAIQDIWYKIPPEYCQKLVHSVPRRLKACKQAYGGHTKY